MYRPGNHLIYPLSSRRWCSCGPEPTGTADVELEEEQWREWHDEFEQAYSEGAFFLFVSERYMEVLIDFFRIDLLHGGAEARSSWRVEGTVP